MPLATASGNVPGGVLTSRDKGLEFKPEAIASSFGSSSHQDMDFEQSRLGDLFCFTAPVSYGT